MTVEHVSGEIAVIITAAGSSSRFRQSDNGTSSTLKKEYHLLAAEGDAKNEPLTVLGAAVSAFAAIPLITKIIITVPPDAETGESAARSALNGHLLKQNRCKIYFVPGGNSRRLSVYNALKFLAVFAPDYVLIHDGARPWISKELINKTIEAVLRLGAVVPTVPLCDTPKELDDDGNFVVRHLTRAKVTAAQTPQAFLFSKILEAHTKACEAELQDNKEWTDDAEIWGAYIGKCAVIAGDEKNKKITYARDLLQ
ncbi:MAG: IspD/TarI family cytidylyltransferase [Termitinemataceae bacterium]|nr:MAG: IspD/TarI family cytidylyltransferase [Termitinemataceae bacterium]